MRIVNLTQHSATADQAHVGVFEVRAREELKSLLTFSRPPTQLDLVARAAALASIAKRERATAAMIGGAPYLMAPLEAALRAAGIKPRYAFAVRDSIDEPLFDDQGVQKIGVRKIQVFRHAGWVYA